MINKVVEYSSMLELMLIIQSPVCPSQLNKIKKKKNHIIFFYRFMKTLSRPYLTKLIQPISLIEGRELEV